MAVQRTFSILKPDVTRRNLTGAVNQRIEAAGPVSWRRSACT
jgi:nucleoside-diphosphate kinase